ncbi:MAG: Flp pilus assembly protein CpaB [Deltaproteobacteria bacterium]
MQDRRAFLISVSFSVLAMYLVYQYISGEEQRLSEMYKKTVTVVRAKRDILQYGSIRPTDVETISVPKAIAPAGAIDIKEDAFDAVAAVPISQGEFILDNKLISKNVYSGLESQISKEKRAISIPVNVKSAVGYLLRPGNRVDLAAHFEYLLPKPGSNGTKNASEVKVFLQDLLVLASGRTIQTTPPKAVDQNIIRSLRGLKDDSLNAQTEGELREALNFAKEDKNYQTVTLEVTPQQAQTLVYVQSLYGESLTLQLRHTDDRQLESRQPANLAKVMGPESYLNKGNKLPPPIAIPKYKFFDYVGDSSVPVPAGGP